MKISRIRQARRVSMPGSAWLLAIGACMYTPTALADDSPHDKVAAEALFQDARQLMEKSEFVTACPKLVESQRLDPAVGTLLYLALCLEQTGKTASAWQTYLSAESAARAAGQSDRERSAHERATALESKLTRLKIHVAASSLVTGLQVTLDDVALGQAAWDSAVPVDPGEHTVSAKAPSKKPWSSKVRLSQPGSTQTVEIPVLENEGASATAAPLAGAPSAPSASTSLATSEHDVSSGEASQKYLGVGLGLAGVVGFGIGTVFAIKAHSKDTESNKNCGTSIGLTDANACNPRGMTLNADAKSSANVSKLSFGLGGALLISGVVVYLTAPKSKQPSALRLAPQVGDHIAALNVMGAF